MKKLLIGALFATSIAVGSAGAASAQVVDKCPYPSDCIGLEVKGTTIDAPVATPVTPAAPKVAAQAALPVTGVETGVLAGAGLALIAGGGLLVLRSRKADGATA